MTNMSGPMSHEELQAFRVAISEERIFKMILIISTHVLFIYINIVMMAALRSKTLFQETARYVLFSHMLLNDTIHLIVGLLLYLMAAFYITVVRAVCAFIVLLSSMTFTNAPLNLAVMSLERYMAICLPLRHGKLTTLEHTRLAIALVWVLGCVNVVIDLVALFLTEPSFYVSASMCTLEHLQSKKWQKNKGLALNVLLFTTVAAVLVYTYRSILVVANSASSDRASVLRALHTVLLHSLQLGLSLMSFLYVLFEFLLTMLPFRIFLQLRFINFFVVLILPRCLSSLIYGLRDEAFKPVFRQYFVCCSSKKVGPSQLPPKC